jgi:hypothetical protein
MKIKPVINSTKPKYPDKYEIELNKTLLYYRPQRWLKEPLIGLALTALMTVGLSGCRIGDGFGDDYGALAGNVVVDPSIYYISDKDALNIIADELQKARYQFVMGGDKADFEFDAQIIDGDNKINLEYVSIEDLENNKYDLAPYFSLENTAKELNDTYKDAAIFYDPEWPEHLDAEQALRAQVLDFIEWLRSIDTEG